MQFSSRASAMRLVIVATLGLPLTGCAYWRAECECPTDIRYTYDVCGHEAVRCGPCGVDRCCYGYKPTHWRCLNCPCTHPSPCPCNEVYEIEYPSAAAVPTAASFDADRSIADLPRRLPRVEELPAADSGRFNVAPQSPPNYGGVFDLAPATEQPEAAESDTGAGHEILLKTQYIPPPLVAQSDTPQFLY
ncbi:hypothetical protein Pla123a_07130 [Posidoniimonas polymericola]|uniref:TNFR-Cys domain-containing protein n=1 Tax=Posidoniimonas polymericola TaxID=2528002 RepID=A0A5C5ZFD5_9BACT|nr:hypothetical protein [Posidoniimonas polymericola]TWT85906.1 hypothetical protein Pla123a_07130 [Posidoniimonas polymericola]